MLLPLLLSCLFSRTWKVAQVCRLLPSGTWVWGWWGIQANGRFLWLLSHMVTSHQSLPPSPHLDFLEDRVGLTCVIIGSFARGCTPVSSWPRLSDGLIPSAARCILPIGNRVSSQVAAQLSFSLLCRQCWGQNWPAPNGRIADQIFWLNWGKNTNININLE